MKWFKHFTDNHRGRSIQTLLDNHGHKGPSTYYAIKEMCAEKLEKKSDRDLLESDCEFQFPTRVVANSCRVSVATLSAILRTCNDLKLFEAEVSKKQIKIHVPMLLDLLDYDHKKTRERRVSIVSGNRLEKSIEEKNIEDNINTVEYLFEGYPNKVGKLEGLKRLFEQISSPEVAKNFQTAKDNYVRFLGLEKNKGWLQAKQFSTFVGAKTKKDKPWHEWVKPDPAVFVDTPNSKTDFKAAKTAQEKEAGEKQAKASVRRANEAIKEIQDISKTSSQSALEETLKTMGKGSLLDAVLSRNNEEAP